MGSFVKIDISILEPSVFKALRNWRTYNEKIYQKAFLIELKLIRKKRIYLKSIFHFLYTKEIPDLKKWENLDWYTPYKNIEDLAALNRLSTLVVYSREKSKELYIGSDDICIIKKWENIDITKAVKDKKWRTVCHYDV